MRPFKEIAIRTPIWVFKAISDIKHPHMGCCDVIKADGARRDQGEPNPPASCSGESCPKLELPNVRIPRTCERPLMA